MEGLTAEIDKMQEMVEVERQKQKKMLQQKQRKARCDPFILYRLTCLLCLEKKSNRHRKESDQASILLRLRKGLSLFIPGTQGGGHSGGISTAGSI